MNNFKINLSLLSLVLICGCSAPKLAKRYKSSNNRWISDNAVKRYVDVKANSFRTREQPKINLIKEVKNEKDFYNLPEKAQVVIIEQALKTNPDLDINKFLMKLNSGKNKQENTKPKKKTITQFIDNNINKNIVFSISRMNVAPTSQGTKIFHKIGDRIQFLDLKVTIPEHEKILIRNWNKFENDYSEIDLGTLTSSKSISANITTGYSTSSGFENGSSINQTTSGNNSTITNNSAQTNNTQTSNSNNSFSNINDNFTSNTEFGNSNNSVNSYGSDVANTIGSQFNNVTNQTSKITGNATFNPNANLTLNDKLDEQRSLKYKIIKLTGELTEKSFSLKQEGYEGIDLKGNMVVNFDFEFTGNYAPPIKLHKFSDYQKMNQKTKEFEFSNYEDLSKEIKIVYFPDIRSDLCGKLYYSYLYRQIKKRDKYIPEYNHRVKFVFGETPKNIIEEVVLVKKEDLRPKVYRIKDEKNYLKIENEILNFETEIEAMKFMTWFLHTKDNSKKTSKYFQKTSAENWVVTHFQY